MIVIAAAGERTAGFATMLFHDLFSDYLPEERAVLIARILNATNAYVAGAHKKAQPESKK